MNPEIYNLSISDLNERLSLKDPLLAGHHRNVSKRNSVFTSAYSWALICGRETLSHTKFFFKGVSFNRLFKKLNEKYGEHCHSRDQQNSKQYFWRTEDGLTVCFIPGKTYSNILISNSFAKTSSLYKDLDDMVGGENFGLGQPEEGRDLAKLIGYKNSEGIFNLTSNDLQKVFFSTFVLKWTDKFKRSARSTVPLKFFNSVSNETIFFFKDNKLSKITLMIYNKGDQQQNLGQQTFTKVINSLEASIDELTASKGHYKPNAGVARNFLYWWSTLDYLVKLESSYTKTSRVFTSDYIRLSISKPIKGINASNVDKVNIISLSASELKEMVVRDSDGAVYISGVPMVDQGQKGYCACAATARLLNYYGRDIDQHDLAKLAMTDKYGTSIDELKKALSIISSKLRLHVQSVAPCYLGSDRDFKRFIKKLEFEYKRNGWAFKSPLKVKDLEQVFAAMSAKDQRYKDFKKGIKRSIDSGKPLVWALALGIIPEPEIPQAEGGHMRLIIGYNESTDKIYYTDSWGEGHEKKSMDLKSAFWISSAIWELRPR